MQYIKYDLGNQRKGSVVEITLSAATNVMLMDKVNLDLMQNSHKYNYIGHYVTMSPHRMTIPEDKHWFLVIELLGTIKHSVKVIPPKL